MKTVDFSYTLPSELIAQYPAKRRDESRLMVLHRQGKWVEHRQFQDVVHYLREGDCLVINETRVIPARLRGRRKDTGGKVEVLLLQRVKGNTWEVLVRPGRRAQPGVHIHFGDDGLVGEVIEKGQDGCQLVRFKCESDFDLLLERLGEVPLPPYIRRPPVSEDRWAYQTVYARTPGAVAAPTAGLHFTPELLRRIEDQGVEIVPVLLHVGWGTFRPVSVSSPREHRMEEEYYRVGPDAAQRINSVREKGGRVVAVGTTVVRTLETVVDSNRRVHPGEGWTDKFIYPPYEFKAVDVLITNFHLPRSTLLMLVCAFAGRDFVLEAYQEAVKQKYRFYSYGDAMLIL